MARSNAAAAEAGENGATRGFVHPGAAAGLAFSVHAVVTGRARQAVGAAGKGIGRRIDAAARTATAGHTRPARLTGVDAACAIGRTTHLYSRAASHVAYTGAIYARLRRTARCASRTALGAIRACIGAYAAAARLAVGAGWHALPVRTAVAERGAGLAAEFFAGLVRAAHLARAAASILCIWRADTISADAARAATVCDTTHGERIAAKAGSLAGDKCAADADKAAEFLGDTYPLVTAFPLRSARDAVCSITCEALSVGATVSICSARSLVRCWLVVRRGIGSARVGQIEDRWWHKRLNCGRGSGVRCYGGVLLCRPGCRYDHSVLAAATCACRDPAGATVRRVAGYVGAAAAAGYQTRGAGRCLCPPQPLPQQRRSQHAQQPGASLLEQTSPGLHRTECAGQAIEWVFHRVQLHPASGASQLLGGSSHKGGMSLLVCEWR
jgi:hypothetical protein